MDRRGRPKLDRWQPLLSLKAAPRQARAEGTGGLIEDYPVYDANGRLLTGNLADYLIATARLSKDPRDCDRKPPVTEQPARRQGRRRGHDHPDPRPGGLAVHATWSEKRGDNPGSLRQRTTSSNRSSSSRQSVSLRISPPFQEKPRVSASLGTMPRSSVGQRRAPPRNIVRRSGGVSVGLYSSTAGLPDADRNRAALAASEVGC